MKQIEWVGGVAFFVLGYGIGALFMGLAVSRFLEIRRHLARYSGRAIGTVVSLDGPDDQGCTRPRVQFPDAGGTVTVTGVVGSRPPAYRIGQAVVVRFPPGESEKALIADFKNLYEFPMVFGLLGGGMLAVLSIMLLKQ